MNGVRLFNVVISTGVFTITPQLAGYLFTPSYRVISVPGSKVKQDFTAMFVAKVLYLPLMYK